MTEFEMVKYHNQKYPDNIPLRIEEVAAHFDVDYVHTGLGYSLHTEYSYGKRKFNSKLMEHYSEIRDAHKDGVPQLWKSEAWARQFAEFIVHLICDDSKPKIVEIHPPFSDYTNLNTFVNNYSVFEGILKEHYPEVGILIENRCGSVYRGGKFILSKIGDIHHLAELIDSKGLELRMAYDVPQIYTAHNAKTENQFVKLLDDTKDVRWFIGGVHLWGKRVSPSGRKVAHCGDLNSYFEDVAIKKAFLNAFVGCFSDDMPRKMVLEVNSGNEDLMSIVKDLMDAGVTFI